MKYFQIITMAMITFVLIVACSDSSSPDENPRVKVIGELATPTVNMVKPDKLTNTIQSNEVDSIRVIRVRILMSRMMLFQVNDNTTSGNVVKTEPFVYDLSLSGGESIMGNHEVPIGLYDRLKIEIHRFNLSDLIDYADDPIFKDFATVERHTILIEGVTYVDENPSTFTFHSNAVANLMLNLETALNLKGNSNTTIALQVDPNYFFKKWEAILDPNDYKNANDIENALINTIKAIKK